MAKVGFYRGLKATYDAEKFADGIYFTLDTNEILMNGNVYGYNADTHKEITTVEYTAPSTIVLTYTNGESDTIELQTAEAGETAEDSTAGLISAADVYKLNTVEEGAQANVIESVSVNGTAVEVDENKNVNIDLDGAIDISSAAANILSKADDGLYASVTVKQVSAPEDDTTVEYRYQLYGVDSEGTETAIDNAYIDIKRNSALTNITIGEIPEGKDNAGDEALIISYQLADGTTDTYYVDISDLFGATAGDGLQYTTNYEGKKQYSIKVDSTNNEVDASGNAYLQVDADGIKIVGLNAALAALSVTVNEKTEGHVTVTVEANEDGSSTVTVEENDIASAEDVSNLTDRVTALEEAWNWIEPDSVD